MTFDDITGDRKLWAVHFEGEDDNEFYKVFNNWADVVWLRTFFKENIDDLNAYFKITDIKEAISDTIEDSERLRYIIMDISPETDLSKIFRPLDNNQASDMMLQKEKARFHGCPQPVIAYHGLSSFWLLKSVKPGFSMAIINKWIIP